MKYLYWWITTFVVFGGLIFTIVSFITSTQYDNILGEDVLMLLYIGFSTIMASIVTSTKYLSDLIKHH